jgi:hypothetical protein
MTAAVAELAELPAGLVLGGELVAWRDGEPTSRTSATAS